jgi:hypothetical protein
MPSFGSGSDSQVSLLIRLHLKGVYLVTNGLSQRVNRPFLHNIFVRVLAFGKSHFLLRSDRARINPVAFPGTEATPAPYSQPASPAPASRRSRASKQNVRLAASCDRASPHHDRERGTQLGRPNMHMRKLITTIALLALVDSSAAIAQTAGSRNPAAVPLMNSAQQLLPEAPVGHRQPRVDQVPSEKNLMDPNDPVNQENAALDRMISGICRGC